MGKYKGYTPAHGAAQRRYMQGHVEIRARVTVDYRDIIQAHAQARGESVNAFLTRAIAETMERDKADIPATAQEDADG